MKKIWQITGTKDQFADNKQELKKVRTQLNADAGIDEADKEVASKDWKFKITKGPDHPRLKG